MGSVDRGGVVSTAPGCRLQGSGVPRPRAGRPRRQGTRQPRAQDARGQCGHSPADLRARVKKVKTTLKATNTLSRRFRAKRVGRKGPGLRSPKCGPRSSPTLNLRNANEALGLRRPPSCLFEKVGPSPRRRRTRIPPGAGSAAGRAGRPLSAEGLEGPRASPGAQARDPEPAASVPAPPPPPPHLRRRPRGPPRGRDRDRRVTLQLPSGARPRGRPQSRLPAGTERSPAPGRRRPRPPLAVPGRVPGASPGSAARAGGRRGRRARRPGA